ncbi:Tat pathway signal sequence domain protein [Streptomyces spinoverrucosus]|uniref:Tat pathway signal sequence domain protein n=1 Tax=Streptomyces spinoverrucosus TaxID=284043 RepID=UPI0018C3FBD5|nr:Tat pathway signal sequence domain protein [Streptomyces spinoverrucosus]MBG0851676.1 Tat pathway signal sequence domain protein [Streptomyces spinoverrucosus]
MRNIVHRHLGKVVAGAAIAVAGTAVMVGITLPGTAGADDTAGGTAGGRGAQQAAQSAGEGQAAVPPGVVEQAPAQGEKGTGRDPLTEDEMKRVERIALSRQPRGSGEDVDGDRGPQRLGVDLAEPEAGELGDAKAPRRAEVSFYDYRDDTLVTRTVNLDTGKVERTASQQGVQPPLSRDEANEAARLLIADPLGAGLKADYKDATGKELTSPDQLLLNSMVYRAAPGAQPAVLDQCGEHRCVRLFPKVKNGPWIDARSLVVDLSARKVGELAD